MGERNRNTFEHNFVRDADNRLEAAKEKGSSKNLSFRGKIEDAKSEAAFEKAMSNPESVIMKIAEEIIKNKSYIEIRGLTPADYRNYTRDSGENPYMLAAACEELAERRAGLKEVHENE